MTQEEKQLLLKDLCARLSYRPKGVRLREMFDPEDITIVGYNGRFVETINDQLEPEKVKLYLRPMSSMTEEEQKEYIFLYDKVLQCGANCMNTILSIDTIDWLISHGFDYRGLIEKGIAIKAPKDMYNIETKSI